MTQRLHKVRGNTLDEAYQAMRRKFGPEAVVVNTAQIVEGGVLGFFGQKRYEITISVPAAPQVRRPSPVERRYQAHSTAHVRPPETVAYFEQLVRDAQRRMHTAPPAEPAQAADAKPAAPAPVHAAAPDTGAGSAGGPAPLLQFPQRKPQDDAATESLRKELAEIREMLQVLYSESPGAGLPSEFAPHYRTLIDRGVSRKVAAQMLGAVVSGADLAVLRDPRVFAERLRFEMHRRIQVNGGIAIEGGQCRVVALTGPTGVGKTTSLAKLAAAFAVRERARVAMITADTYRIAAPEQLRVYANIVGVPLRVVNDAKEVASALRDFREYDLVFIDTAGGSQFNLEQLHELKGVLNAARPHETLLTLAANTPIEDLRNVVANFNLLKPTAALFTKLDETRQYGALFSLLLESGLPLSYVTTGQNVPDDIAVATQDLVAGLLLKGKD